MASALREAFRGVPVFSSLRSPGATQPMPQARHYKSTGDLGPGQRSLALLHPKRKDKGYLIEKRASQGWKIEVPLLVGEPGGNVVTP